MVRKAIYLLLLAAITACSKEGVDGPDSSETPDTSERTRVNIVTRGENDDAIDGLQAGLYMVNYIDGRSDELLASNNYVNNQLLTWGNGGWTTATPIYWSDMDTRADFYVYAPYVETVANARMIPLSVNTDQRSDKSFVESDFLWGTIQGQQPSADGFALTLSHQLSRLTVKVTTEGGFTEGELSADDISVTIGGTKTSATIDLQTSAITVLENSTSDVRCHANGDLSYTAILLPQQVPFSNLVQVDWKGSQYTLQNSCLLESRRQYTLTVKLKKTKSGFDVGIEGWDILPEDFGGVIGGD